MIQVLILGGYGNFGSRIAEALLKKNISIIIAGREQQKAQALQSKLIKHANPDLINIAIFDANKELDQHIAILKPTVVINTIGPFQLTDYTIAKACIQHGVNYVDLADARDFVTGITSLDVLAKQKQVLVVSGASTVPGLSSAVLDHYKSEFSTMDTVIYGISPGQKAPRGLATTESILTYLGKPLKPWGPAQECRYGWQNIYKQPYPELGKRWMANCDIPDLDIFPERYGIKSIQFSAGMENGMLHLGMWVMSWLVRLGLPLNLSNHAKFLLRCSHLFDGFGTPDGGMHILMRGKDASGKEKEIKWFVIAKKGDGPQIPCVPAIILAKKLIDHHLVNKGALPCVGLITLEEYLQELKEFSIQTIVETYTGHNIYPNVNAKSLSK